eukprot:7807476-Prorocentrum_lima.AAC.1
MHGFASPISKPAPRATPAENCVPYIDFSKSPHMSGVELQSMTHTLRVAGPWMCARVGTNTMNTS